MQCQHVDPDEAWKIHEDVGAYNSIGVHWGTFKLSHEVSSTGRIVCLTKFLCTMHGPSVICRMHAPCLDRLTDFDAIL